ncbi:plasmalemma vesicle associated protein b [Mastacembelus armatus]|uniref:plasmalemma vesicle associated protein b n=1 Tax=Mastacembelus armatus TaxID=205130 RepID=UPI000E45DA51|nr:plasmalemma vesicle-associated protein [Mastacembelus armatus]
MYSSGYSQAKLGLAVREHPRKPKGKSCGYYMRIIFFFSSLIQSLIIVSLVLFLIYGQPEKSAEEKRVEELQLSFNRLSDSHVQLRKEKSELIAQLGARTAEKVSLEKVLVKLKTDANTTQQELKMKLQTCESRSSTFSIMARRPSPPIQIPTSSELKTLQSLNAQQKAMINLIEANFTQTVQYLSQERDNALKDRDTHHQDAITQRRENTILKEELKTYTGKCKEDFSESLAGIKTVTREFLNQINTIFPHDMTFYLTCESQKGQMEKIRNSCSNLSRDVENKFQLYLDNVGKKVSEIQATSSRLEVRNSHLTSDLQQCERNRTETAVEVTRQQQLKQKIHDDQMEKLLLEQNRLREQKRLQEASLALKEKEIQTLKQTVSSQPSYKPFVLKGNGLHATPEQDRQTVPSANLQR